MLLPARVPPEKTVLLTSGVGGHGVCCAVSFLSCHVGMWSPLQHPRPSVLQQQREPQGQGGGAAAELPSRLKGLVLSLLSSLPGSTIPPPAPTSWR